MAEKLTELLAGAETFGAAMSQLEGKTLNVDHGLPNPPRFQVVEVKSDYVIGLWQNKEFFAKFDLKTIYSLAG